MNNGRIEDTLVDSLICTHCCAQATVRKCSISEKNELQKVRNICLHLQVLPIYLDDWHGTQ